MPNEIVDFHRKKFPGDKRSDVQLTIFYTTQMGRPWVEANGKKVPDFYRDYRSTYYGSESEFGKGVARGVQGLQSTAMGGLGLALDAVPGEVGFVEDWKKSALQSATEFGERAADPRLAPREPAFKNVGSAGQAVDYLGALFGEAAPSVAESVVVGAAGALAGSAAAPGPGTIAGGLTGIVGKTAAKKVLKDAVAKKLKNLTGDQVKNALAKKGSKEIISQVDGLIKRRAKSMTAQFGAATANALNSYGLSSGEIYNELANDPTVDPDDAFNISLSFGAVAAAPDTILPSLVLKRMGVFDRIAGIRGATSTAASRSGFMRYLTRFLPTAAQATGIEAATEGFQEYVNISAEKYAKDLPFDLSSEEIDRIRRAGALGAAGGFMVSPMAAINIREEADKFTTEEGEELGPDAKPVAPRKKLVVPAPAAPIAPEVDARLMQLALLYLQGKVQSDPELSKEYFEAKKDLAQRQRLMELQAEFRDQIAADKLASEEAAEGWTKTLAKVLKKEPLTDEEAAQVVSRGGQIIEAGGAKFGSSPEAMNDPEAQEDLDPEAAETPVEDTAEPAETAVVPPPEPAVIPDESEVIPDESEVIPAEVVPDEEPQTLFQKVNGAIGVIIRSTTPEEDSRYRGELDELVKGDNKLKSLADSKLKLSFRLHNKWKVIDKTREADGEGPDSAEVNKLVNEAHTVAMELAQVDVELKEYQAIEGKPTQPMEFTETGSVSITLEKGKLPDADLLDAVGSQFKLNNPNEGLDTTPPKGVQATKEEQGQWIYEQAEWMYREWEKTGFASTIDETRLEEAKDHGPGPVWVWNGDFHVPVQPLAMRGHESGDGWSRIRGNVDVPMTQAQAEKTAENIKKSWFGKGYQTRVDSRMSGALFGVEFIDDRSEVRFNNIPANTRFDTDDFEFYKKFHSEFGDKESWTDEKWREAFEFALDQKREAVVPAEVGPVEFDYGKVLNPFIATVKSAPQPPVSEVNKFIEADIAAKENRIKELQETMAQAATQLEELKALFRSQAPEGTLLGDKTEGEIGKLQTGVYALQDRVNKISSQISIQGKRIELLKASLVAEDSFIDADTGQVVTAASLSEDSLGYEDTVPLSVERREDTAYGATKVSFSTIDRSITGGQAAPAYYEIDPDTVDSYEQAAVALGVEGQSVNGLAQAPLLDAQSVTKDAKGGTRAANDVRRLTAFLNKETGEVFVLGTGKQRLGKAAGEIVFYVDRGKGKKGYLTQEDVASQGNLIPFASMRLTSPRSKPMFYYESLGQYREVMGNAPARLIEAKDAALKSAASVQTGDVSQDKSPSQLAAEKSAIELTMLLTAQPKILESAYDAIDAGEEIAEADYEALVEVATVLIAGRAKQGDLSGIQSLEAAGVSLDNPQEIHEYLGEQWLIKFNEVKRLADETENPKETFINVLTSEAGLQPQPVREEAPRQIESDIGRQDPTRPDQIHESRRRRRPSKLARLYKRLPQEAVRSLEEGNLAAAAYVAGEVRRTIQDSEPEPRTLTERVDLDKKIKVAEGEALQKWAAENGMMSDRDAFLEAYEEGGGQGGVEHKIIFEGEVVRKANDISMHATWSAYFERLAITNFLFPEAPYELVGFSFLPEHPKLASLGTGQADTLHAISTQPTVESGRRESALHDMQRQNPAYVGYVKEMHARIDEKLMELGFFPVTKDASKFGLLTAERKSGFHYYNPELGIQISDLHSGNAYITPEENLAVFDADAISPDQLQFGQGGFLKGLPEPDRSAHSQRNRDIKKKLSREDQIREDAARTYDHPDDTILEKRRKNKAKREIQLREDHEWIKARQRNRPDSKIPSAWKSAIAKESKDNRVTVSAFEGKNGFGEVQSWQLKLRVGVDEDAEAVESIVRDDGLVLHSSAAWPKAVWEKTDAVHPSPRKPTAFRKILKHIIQTHKEGSRETAMAEKLLAVEDPPLVVVTDGTMDEKAHYSREKDREGAAFTEGTYRAVDHVITLNDWNHDSSMIEVFLHEAWHARTLNAINFVVGSSRANEEFVKTLTPALEGKAPNEVVEIMGKTPGGRFNRNIKLIHKEGQAKWEAFNRLVDLANEKQFKGWRLSDILEFLHEEPANSGFLRSHDFNNLNKKELVGILRAVHELDDTDYRFLDYLFERTSEFAVGITNPGMVAVLNAMEASGETRVSEKRRSLWDKVVQVFADLFGAAKGSLLESSIAETLGFHYNDRNKNIKFSPREAVDPLSPSNEQVRQQFYASLQSLATAGVNVQVLETGLKSQLGMYVDRAIQLVVPDLANPTKDTVRLLLHEAGHQLFDDMSIGLQGIYHKAIKNLTDAELQVESERLAGSIAPDNPIDETTQEERLVDSVARELTDAGFDPSIARSMVQRVLAYLRELYLRAYIEVQKALLGPEHVNGEKARQYFKLRLESYLTKNYSPNAITMMGGAPMTAESIGQTRRSDRSDVTKVYDFNTGIVELKEIEAETLEDVLWNSRRRVKFLGDGTSEEIPIDPKPELSRLKVVEEYMEETYSEMYDMWNQAGLNLDGVSLEDFVKNTLKTKMPSEKIEALIKEGARADATLDNLEETSARPRAAKQIFIRLKKAKAKFEAAKGKAYSAKSESALKRSQNIADKLKEFQTKYTDLTTYTKNIVGIIDQALKEYTTGTKASKPHIVSRILKKLDPKYKYKNYKSDLEKARKRALNMEDVLAAIGDMDLDFVGTDPEELAVQIRDALGDSTPGNKVKDNVVIASLLGFAKRYPEAMILLQLRGEKNRARVDQAIRLMLSDNVAGISEARRLLRETITKTRQGERLHQRILVLKRKIRSIFDQQDKLQRQVDAGVAVGPLLTQRSEEVSALFEAEEAVKASQWEPMHSTWFYVPPSPEATVDEIWDNKENRQTIKLSPDEDFGRITKIIEMQTAWLKANGDVGERHGLIKRQRDGLMEVQADFTQHQLRQNVVTRMVGDRASKMEGIGGPQAKQIARRDRRFVSLLHTYGGNLTQQKGVAWAKAEKEAVKATGSYNLDEFKNRFYAPFLTFAAENTEILESFPGNVKAAENEVIRKAKIYLSDRTNGESDKAWPQLEKLFRLTASRNGIVDNMRDKMGVKVLEEVKIGGRVKRFFRTTIGSPLFSIMRRTKDNTELMYNFMRQNWGDTRIRKQEIIEAVEAGPEALAALFEGRFEDRVMEEFVEPIMNRPKGAFPMPEATGGENFDPAEISEAWEATEGLEGEEKIIQFAYNLAQQAITSEEQLVPAVADILKVFPRYFGQLRKLYEKKEENKSMNPVPVHTMMDARIAQNFPSEWLDYSTYTEREMRYYAESLAYEAAYGRDLVGIFSDFDELKKVLSDRADAYKRISTEVMKDGAISRTQKEREIGRRANAEGGIRVLKGAAKDLDVVNTEEARFLAILKNKAEQLEYNASMELVSALTGATVQGMTTAITDMSTALEGPFRKFGLSSFGLSALFKNIKYTSLEAIGTLIQLLPISWNVNAERVKRRTRLGIVDDDSLVSFRERYVSNMADEFRSSGMTGKAMEGVSRAVKTVLQAGLGKAKRKDQLYTTLKAAPFTMFVNWQSAGSTDSLFDLFTDFVGRAGEFFDNNPAAMADENYQLTSKDLGFKDRLFGLIQNEKAFDYIVNTLQQHGLNPTRLGREWVLNGKTNPLTDEHYRRIAALSATEIMLENTAVTQPSWMMSNKIALMARPLLRWGFIKTGDLAKQLPMIADLQNLNIKDPNTRKALKAYRDFGMAMAMAIIPISLAWAMVRDKYEEEALGKRANLMRFGEANPFFVMLDRLDRVGTFGMAGEMANTLINMENSRQFGIDNRVFAVNSVLSLNKAMGTWIRQGEATYATVGRPAMMALGFGGALQNFQLSNSLLGLDNFESRYSARVNVNNILRSAGKELGLDVRKFSGGGALPTPMKPWMTEMVLSAYANDAIAFRNAYGMALKAAEAMGKEDPVKSVKSSLTMYHPLRYVFRSPPLEDDFSRIQRAAGGSGRQAINEAVSLFNRYGEMLGITPYMGKKEKKSGAVDLFKKPSGFSVPRVNYKSFSVDKGSLLPF